jgi:D-amino-acid dehydrogenase
VHTVVIGAGVIGLTTAYHLAREGESVTLVDARRTGLGASEVNAGWWVPAEASPIPGPGVVSMALDYLPRKNADLRG